MLLLSPNNNSNTTMLSSFINVKVSSVVPTISYPFTDNCSSTNLDVVSGCTLGGSLSGSLYDNTHACATTIANITAANAKNFFIFELI